MKTALIFSSLLLSGSLMMKKPITDAAAGSTTVVKTAKKSKRVSSPMPKGAVKIIVDKSSYELYVYDSEGWYATYPVVFGNNSLEDKKMEGDKNTPEGTFRIISKRVHEKWERFMGLDYPTKESLERFNMRKKRGEIPSHAKPGGAIGLHGTWPNDDFMIDRYKNWTNGCISLKNIDIDELYSYVPVGTPITIRK